MARFFGRYEHSLDVKGRVILPAKFRARFEEGGFLTPHNESCLALWTPEQFEIQMEEMERREAAGTSDERNLARFWSSRVQEVEIDRQGRMAIGQPLREFARFTTDVLVVGAISRVELWDPQLWNEQVVPAERHLTEVQ